MTRNRVLVVDDNDDICANVKDILNDLGYDVDTAQNGFAAIELATVNTYDVIVLDYKMTGMDGATLHQHIIRIRPGITAIMVTAYADGDGRRRAAESGIQHVLRKPVDLFQLLPLIEASPVFDTKTCN